MIDVEALKKIRDVKSLSKFVDEKYPDGYRAMISDLSRAVSELLMRDMKAALKIIGHISRIRDYMPENLQPKLLAVEARYLHRTGESRRARVLYDRAVTELRRFRDFESSAQARMGLMDVMMYLGENTDAIKVGKSLLRYYRRKNRSGMSARVMTNIGNVYHRMDRNQIALDYYNKARVIFETEGGVPLAVIDYNRANIYTNLNDLDRAAELYARAAKIYSENSMGLAAARARYSLGYIHFLSGRYTEAITVFENVIDEFDRLGDGKAGVVSRLDLVEIDVYLNQYGSAIMLADTVVSDSKALGLEYESAKAAYFAAEAFLELGESAESRKYLKIAEREFSRERNPLWIGMCLLLKGKIAARRNQHLRAIECAREARTHFARSGDTRRKSDAELFLADVEMRLGRIPVAVRRLRALLRNGLFASQRQCALNILGQCCIERDKYNEALEYFGAAMETVENTLANLYPDELRHFYLAGNYDTYVRAAECHLNLGNSDESFITLSRALALLNSKHTSASKLPGGLSERYLQERNRLRLQLKKMSLPPSGDKRSTSVVSSSRIEERLWKVERKLRVPRYRINETESFRHMDTVELMSYLAEDEILVSFAEIAGRVIAFVAGSRGIEHHELSISPAELRSRVFELGFVCENAVFDPHISGGNSGGIRRTIELLNSELFSHVLPANHNGGIILLLEGVFAQIPFWAFSVNSRNHIYEEYKLRVISDPADLKRRREDTRITRQNKSVVFAVQSAELPMIDREVKAIESLFNNTTLFSDADATTEALIRSLGETDGFVHIATHASRSSENPLFSRLLMYDGPFFPFDLFDGGINSKLVVLSGCQTAGPGIYYGNTFSLAKAFYQAGARFVLASLWPISDKIGMLFMRSFYEALGSGRDIPHAYSEALTEIHSINDDEAYWAPFILLGM